MNLRFTAGIALMALMAGCSTTGHSASRQVTTGASTAPTIIVTRDDGSLPVRCGVQRTASRVVEFIDAFNRGDAEALDRLIADRQHFQSYGADEGHGTQARTFSAQGLTSGPDEPTPPRDGRPALLRYLAGRHRAGERMHLVQVKITRIAPRTWFPGMTNEAAGIEFSLMIDAPDLASFLGRNRLAGGKGGFGCSDGRLLVWVMGLDTAGARAARAARLCRVTSRIVAQDPSGRRVVACTG